MPTKNTQMYKRMALRTGPLLQEVTTDRKRLKLNGEVTEDNLRKLMDEAEVRNVPIDLSNLNLSGVRGTKIFVGKDLSCSNLSGITSTELDFSNGSLFRAVITGATITKSLFEHTDVTESDVRKADFSFAISFEGVIGLEKARNLGKAKFYGAKKLSETDKAAILKANPGNKIRLYPKRNQCTSDIWYSLDVM